MDPSADVCVLISAGAEWRGLLPHYPRADPRPSPYGDYFTASIQGQQVVFLHGGWGKVAAAGSTQYAIDRWHPTRLVNLGTCGGFQGQVQRGTVILAGRSLIYDIIEQMGDPHQAIDHYTVDLDLSWLPDPPPQPVTVATLLSADRDIIPSEVPLLICQYGATVADWESGAIAWVARNNGLPCLILRTVSDLVSATAGEAYNDDAYFTTQCQAIMADFAQHLPAWLDAFTGCG